MDPNQPRPRSTATPHPSSYEPPADPLADEIEAQERRDRELEKGSHPSTFLEDRFTTTERDAAEFERMREFPS